MRRKSSAEQVMRIRQLAGVGWHAQRIANKLKLDRHTVYGYASLYGIDIPRAPHPERKEKDARDAEIARYAREHLGEPRSAMAVRFGVSPPTIKRILEDAGLPAKRIYDAAGNVVDRLPAKA